MKPIQNPAVAAVFDGYPPKFRRKLLALRELILETAASIRGVGAIEETLKWGEPAYLTSETRSGSTIRIQWKKSAPREYSINFHCQTSLVADFRQQFPQQFTFDGNRRIVFGEDDRVPKGPLASCIAAALTYHRDKKGRAMSVSGDLEKEVVRKLEVAGQVRSRRMFGGVGIYLDGAFCAIVGADSGRLYFKVDESTRADYEAEAMEPFRTPKGTMSYYTVPERVLRDPKLLRAWARKAQAVASRSKRPEKSRRGR